VAFSAITQAAACTTARTIPANGIYSRFYVSAPEFSSQKIVGLDFFSADRVAANAYAGSSGFGQGAFYNA
jgi:hypothetical protein